MKQILTVGQHLLTVGQHLLTVGQHFLKVFQFVSTFTLIRAVETSFAFTNFMYGVSQLIISVRMTYQQKNK